MEAANRDHLLNDDEEFRSPSPQKRSFSRFLLPGLIALLVVLSLALLNTTTKKRVR